MKQRIEALIPQLALPILCIFVLFLLYTWYIGTIALVSCLVWLILRQRTSLFARGSLDFVAPFSIGLLVASSYAFIVNAIYPSYAQEPGWLLSLDTTLYAYRLNFNDLFVFDFKYFVLSMLVAYVIGLKFKQLKLTTRFDAVVTLLTKCNIFIVTITSFSFFVTVPLENRIEEEREYARANYIAAFVRDRETLAKHAARSDILSEIQNLSPQQKINLSSYLWTAYIVEHKIKNGEFNKVLPNGDSLNVYPWQFVDNVVEYHANLSTGELTQKNLQAMAEQSEGYTKLNQYPESLSEFKWQIDSAKNRFEDSIKFSESHKDAKFALEKSMSTVISSLVPLEAQSFAKLYLERLVQAVSDRYLHKYIEQWNQYLALGLNSRFKHFNNKNVTGAFADSRMNNIIAAKYTEQLIKPGINASTVRRSSDIKQSGNIWKSIKRAIKSAL